MSFIPSIRDYIELLNNVYDSLAGDINVQIVIQQSFIYILESIKNIIFYIFTFGWFRDFFYLPILIPKISSLIFKENLFFADPSASTFSFLELSVSGYNKFFVGFLNSFFLSLPISCAHLIYARRLLIQGDIAGLAAGLGNILGQFFFIGSIIFGIRLFIIPWFSLEPITFIVGFILLLTIVYDMSHERVIKIIDIKNSIVLLKIFLLNFALIWTEQSCIFQYLGNLTLHSEPTSIETFSTNTSVQYFIIHFSYLSGILIGSLFFTFTFSFVLKKFSEFLQIKSSILRSTWIIRLNFFFLTSILAFTFTSIPYYGLDYILTGPLGFVSQDKSFKNTLFSQNDLKDPFGILGSLSQNLSIDTDATPFDRGIYLKSPVFQTFEDLNYAGEYASTTRQGSVPLFGRYKEKARKVREAIIKKTDNQDGIQNDVPLQENNNTRKNLSNQLNSFTNDFSNEENDSIDYLAFSPKSENIYVFSNLRKRFETNYKQSVNSTFENILEGTLNDAFFEENSSLAYPEVEKKIKQRYYANPVYKFLLNIDIDNFLNRQPSNFSLSPMEEKELYKKRIILSRYYDSLRFYNKLPYINEFDYLFCGSKSFADRVYNQQFKGTLHVVRRLFSINFQTKPKTLQNLTLKYDQPQYKKATTGIPILHEELKEFDSTSKPFIKFTNQIPLYVGWDENLRKLVITNRLLPRSLTNINKFSENKNASIEFTTWPLSKSILEQDKIKPLISSRLLYVNREQIQNSEYKDLLDLFDYEDSESEVSSYKSLPENIIKLGTDNLNILPPNRGGFLWPGNSALKFSLLNLIR